MQIPIEKFKIHESVKEYFLISLTKMRCAVFLTNKKNKTVGVDFILGNILK